MYLDIGLRSITRNLEHLDAIIIEKLERTTFSEPIAAVILRSTNIYPFDSRNYTLFEDDKQSEQQWRQCEEMIQAHMPGHSLDALHAVAEHRPEYAFRKQPEHVSDRHEGTASARPLWLLRAPKLLPTRNGSPQGFTAMLKGPERIETGWWDDRDIRRDYFVARHAGGSKLWIYKDLRNSNWYLHGRFG